MRNIHILILVLLLALTIALPAHADTFKAMAAPYPPYSVSNGLRVEGMSVATLKTIMEMCGKPLHNKAIKLTPWAYAYESTARKPQRIMLNAQRTHKTEQLYKWVGPIATSKIVLIGRKKDKLFIPLKSDLAKYRIATVRWSRPEKALLAGGMEVENLHRNPTHVNALRKLHNGEVDLLAYNERGVPYIMEGMGMDQSEFTTYYTYDEEPLYFAFSKDTDDQLIKRLNNALQTLKATGEGGVSQFDRMISAQSAK